MSNDPWSTLRKGSRTLLRRQLEAEALHEARMALELEGPAAAVEALYSFQVPLEKVWEQERLDAEANA